MILTIISMTSTPEKQLELKQTLLTIEKNATGQTGCLRFDIYCELEDKNRFSLLGEWENRKDLELYFTSHQFSVLMGTNTLLREALDIAIHTVSSSEGINSVYKARHLKTISI
ncbi:putative quinol monooxygenase [Desulfocurvus sp. DL9XJH121]